MGSAISAAADVVGSIYNIVGEVYAKVYRVIADVTRAVAEAIASVVGAIVDAIGDVLSDIGDALFGWLFAEGGVVTHSGFEPVVTPLDKSGLQLHRTVSVTIMGGLILSPQEARRIASLVSKELR